MNAVKVCRWGNETVVSPKRLHKSELTAYLKRTIHCKTYNKLSNNTLRRLMQCEDMGLKKMAQSIYTQLITNEQLT